jgi:mannose-6-phosphate isomerase-like protein (cupin superfamily)
MNKTVLKVLAVAAVLSPVAVWVVRAQSKPTTATYISKEEIDAVSKSEQDKSTQDMNIKIMDLGYEHMSVGLIHRASTRNRPANAGGGGGGNQPPAEACGRHMDTLPPGGQPGGLTHDFQTEGYYIVSGGGTLFTDGYLVNGRHTDIEPNGWSCGGTAYGVKKVEVKQGDVVIVPPGTVHGWSDIPDHVDYLSFRPSQSALQAGWVNPLIQSMKP